MKNYILTTFLAFLITLLPLATKAVDDNVLFLDINNNHTEYNAIKYLNTLGIFNGYDDGSFMPDVKLKRAELLKIIIETTGLPATAKTMNNCFSDVKDQWFAKYVCYAKDKNYISGYEDNTFKPEQEVNLVETLKILFEITNTSSQSYDISQKISNYEETAWYNKYIETAYATNLIQDNINDVAKPISRVKAASLLYTKLIQETEFDILLVGENHMSLILADLLNDYGLKVGILDFNNFDLDYLDSQYSFISPNHTVLNYLNNNNLSLSEQNYQAILHENLIIPKTSIMLAYQDSIDELANRERIDELLQTISSKVEDLSLQSDYINSLFVDDNEIVKNYFNIVFLNLLGINIEGVSSHIAAKYILSDLNLVKRKLNTSLFEFLLGISKRHEFSKINVSSLIKITEEESGPYTLQVQKNSKPLNLKAKKIYFFISSQKIKSNLTNLNLPDLSYNSYITIKIPLLYPLGYNYWHIFSYDNMFSSLYLRDNALFVKIPTDERDNFENIKATDDILFQKVLNELKLIFPNISNIINEEDRVTINKALIGVPIPTESYNNLKTPLQIHENIYFINSEANIEGLEKDINLMIELKEQITN